MNEHDPRINSYGGKCDKWTYDGKSPYQCHSCLSCLHAKKYVSQDGMTFECSKQERIQ